jgi:hypothetical protein
MYWSAIRRGYAYVDTCHAAPPPHTIEIILSIDTVQLGGSILELALEYSRDLFIFVKKYGKQHTKSFWVNWPFEERTCFSGSSTIVPVYKGPTNFFCKICGLRESKGAEFKVDFKNINLPLWPNASKISHTRLNIFACTQVAPCVNTKIFNLE